MRHGALAAAAAVAAVAWGCRAIPAPANGVLSVSEVQLPSPGVVVGDTMRDSAGRAAPLRVYAFGVGGQADTITKVAATFVVFDRGAHVTADGYLIGDSVRSTPVRVVGSVGSLQTSAANVAVIPVPDSIGPVGPTTIAPDTFSLAKPPSYYSAAMTANVSSAGAPPQAVPSLIVRWVIVRRPAGAPNDTASTIVSTNNFAASADTTDASGNVSVRLHLDPVAGQALTAPDSFVVEARASYRGVPLRGSPVRFVVPIVPALGASATRSGKP
ncbi:MAG: hypothetical protein KGL38_15210 [Gemmatimonadota bacterium]|nr:hypothetical protein [Gemmatimonadota bacterium]MDE3216225.1 hypothetical protein [Gemmatimonadota bacterium]